MGRGRGTRPKATFGVLTAAPALDHAGVEAAQLIRVCREQLVAEEPSAVTHSWPRDGQTLIPSFEFEQRTGKGADARTFARRPGVEPILAVGDAVARLLGCGLSGWAMWRW